MLRYCLLAIFLIPSVVNAQIIISPDVSPQQVAEAQKQIESGQQILKMATDRTARLNVGEFDVIKRGDKLKTELRWLWTDFVAQTVNQDTTALIKRHDVAANTQVYIRMKRAGDKEIKTHVFEPQAEPWSWVEAIKDGEVVLTVAASADAGKMPVIISNIKFILGEPKPIDPPKPPVPPVPPGPPTGLRVILVYGSGDVMTEEQLAILNSPKIEAYLDSHCAKDEKGRPSWRRWAKTVDTTLETQLWKKAWEAVKPQLGPLPQIAIITDQSGKTYPLPETEAKALELLQSIGGK